MGNFRIFAYIYRYIMRGRFLVLSKYLIIILIFLFAASDGMAKEKKQVDKKRQPVALALPMPDEIVPIGVKQQDLSKQDEVKILSEADFLNREGIDVSHYQGMIDWKEVATLGKVGYVYIKATEGSGLQDDMYAYNLREARKNGLLSGSYHFFRSNSTVSEQLANMTSVVKKSEQDLIPIIDVERINGSRSVFITRLHQFMQAVEKHYGCKPILYTFVNFYNKYLQGEGFDKYPLMIAFYRDDQPLLNDEHPYIIWQYTSHGEVPGIDGNVDQSRIMEGHTINDIRF